MRIKEGQVFGSFAAAEYTWGEVTFNWVRNHDAMLACWRYTPR